jgi:hypothetical protein
MNNDEETQRSQSIHVLWIIIYKNHIFLQKKQRSGKIGSIFAQS